MGVAGGPDLIQDGLVLSLDASDRNSYVSGSTTWFDLSGLNNSGSLINGPTFNTGSLGSIVLDGTNDYITLPTVGFGLSSLTVDIWFKRYSTMTTGYLWVMDNFDQPELRLSFSGNKLNVQYYDNGAYIVNTLSTTDFNTALFYNVTTTVTNNSQIFYVNGTQEIIRSGSYDGNPLGNLFEQTLGAYNRPGLGYGGYASVQYGSYKVYNRVLSTQEVLQNYNAQKSKFGL